MILLLIFYGSRDLESQISVSQYRVCIAIWNLWTLLGKPMLQLHIENMNGKYSYCFQRRRTLKHFVSTVMMGRVGMCVRHVGEVAQNWQIVSYNYGYPRIQNLMLYTSTAHNFNWVCLHKEAHSEQWRQVCVVRISEILPGILILVLHFKKAPLWRQCHRVNELKWFWGRRKKSLHEIRRSCERGTTAQTKSKHKWATIQCWFSSHNCKPKSVTPWPQTVWLQMIPFQSSAKTLRPTSWAKSRGVTLIPNERDAVCQLAGKCDRENEDRFCVYLVPSNFFENWPGVLWRQAECYDDQLILLHSQD